LDSPHIAAALQIAAALEMISGSIGVGLVVFAQARLHPDRELAALFLAVRALLGCFLWAAPLELNELNSVDSIPSDCFVRSKKIVNVVQFVFFSLFGNFRRCPLDSISSVCLLFRCVH
jgi:hypothetical protein